MRPSTHHGSESCPWQPVPGRHARRRDRTCGLLLGQAYPHGIAARLPMRRYRRRVRGCQRRRAQGHRNVLRPGTGVRRRIPERGMPRGGVLRRELRREHFTWAASLRRSPAACDSIACMAEATVRPGAGYWRRRLPRYSLSPSQGGRHNDRSPSSSSDARSWGMGGPGAAAARRPKRFRRCSGACPGSAHRPRCSRAGSP